MTSKEEMELVAVAVDSFLHPFQKEMKCLVVVLSSYQEELVLQVLWLELQLVHLAQEMCSQDF